MKGGGMPDEELEQKLLAYFEAEEAELEVPAGLRQRLTGPWGTQERGRRFRYWGRLLVGGARLYPAAAVMLLAVVGTAAWALVTFGGGSGALAPGPERAVMVQVWETPIPPATPAPVPEDQAARSFTMTPSGTSTGLTIAAAWQRGPVLRSETSGVTVRATPQVVLHEGHYGAAFYVAQGPSELKGWKLSPQEVRVTGGQGRNHPLLESKALATVGPLTLGAVSFSLEDPQPGVLKVAIDDFIATSAEGKTQRIDGVWTLEPLERSDREGPSRVLFVLRSPEEACVILGEAGVGAHPGVACPALESPPTPAAPGGTPTPVAASPGLSRAAVTPTPAPVAASVPTNTPAPRPTATPTPRVFSFDSEGARAPTPAPAPPPPEGQTLTFKLYSPEVWYLDVVVGQGGRVSIADLRPATREEP